MAKTYDAGVKEYRETYWMPEYTPIDTDLLTDLDYYKGRAYAIEDVPGDNTCFYAFIAYPIDLLEEGSIVNVLISLVGNVFGFKAVRALHLEDVRFPTAYVLTCNGPPQGIQVEPDILNKYGRACYEGLRGGLDFTKDDENVNSQPSMRWRHRFDFVMKAIHKAEAETGEIELRPGVERLLRETHTTGLRLAIATTTSMANITALFDATLDREVSDWFEVIAAVEQAPVKKSDSSVYPWVLERLGLPAANCLAIEDTRNGVRAASAAGIPVLVTQSYYSEDEDFSGALAVLSDLGEPDRPYQVFAGIDDAPGWINPERLRYWQSLSG